MKKILPPAMLGILGGGQLAKMFTVSAKTMGYHVTILDPDPAAPAAEFADVHLCRPFNDEGGLKELAQCAAVTTEFENVNAQAMLALAEKTQVSPSGHCVAIAQNRILEKSWIRKAGLDTVPYQAITQLSDIDDTSSVFLPGILKTAMLGYDGKGQIPVETLDEVRQAFMQHNQVACVLEKRVDLKNEISVVVCRLDSSHVKTFDPAENYHKNGILAYSIIPARQPENIQKQAKQIAARLADELDYIGVLAVEMFVVGDEPRLLVNEIAPRPHNSGHHTIDACVSSQFDQQVRIMCGLPPEDTRLLSPCCMANILGDEWGKNGTEPHWNAVLDADCTHLYLYGKKVARPARKMGHFTVLSDMAEAAYQQAQRIHAQLKA